MATSITYRILNKLGLKFSEGEYGNISFMFALKRFMKRYINGFLLKYCMYSMFLSPFNSRYVRARLWKWMGARVGKNVFIGMEVLIDTSNAKMIEVQDDVHIANRCILLCHQRDLSNYFVGDSYAEFPYKKGKIVLEKGCALGTNTMIMPGVTIGEGAIIGAYSLVTKDIPAWSIAIGRPAKVVRKVPEKMKE